MGAINYYLKKAEESSGKSLIYLQYYYNGQKLTFSTKQTIDPKNWNSKKQRVKSNTQTTEDGKHALNDLLENLKSELENAYNNEIKTGIPLPATLKNYLEEFLNQNKLAEEKEKQKPTLYHLIDRFVSGEIKKRGKRDAGREKSKATLNNYRTTKLHLQEYERVKKYRIDFDTITLDFFENFTSFLRKGYTLPKKKFVKAKHNTVAKDITQIKIFMNKAVSLGYTINLAFKHEDFSYAEEETDAVYLKEREIEMLFRFDTKNSKLENVKDLFVFGCFVGLRFSDYSNVKAENIIEEEGDLFIKITTQKTKEVVYIPCHPIVLQIFKKYENNTNRLPISISNQKFNQYIKEVCKMAEMDEKGRLTTEPTLHLWQCISSHTARRSFCTNLFLQGFPVREIMKISGHRTEESFNKYIRLTKLDTAKRLNQHMKDLWNRKLLKMLA